METSTWVTKAGLGRMLEGGVIMDVVTPDQARLAEEAGAVAVMALERGPSDIRTQGGVARMSDPELIVGIKEAVTIPVMVKARIGHMWRLKSSRRSGSITSTKARCSPWPIIDTTSPSTASACPPSAAPAISAKPCVVSERSPR